MARGIAFIAGTVVAVSLAVATPAKADSEPALKLQCDAAGNWARMSAIAVSGGQPAAQSIDWREGADCTLANGTAIRVKVSADVDCMWFSLWVNHSKVLSRHPYWCGAEVASHVVISADHIEICDPADATNVNVGRDDRTDLTDTRCRHTAVPAAGSADDVAEYPPPGAPPHPPARSLVMSAGAGDRICTRMRIVENESRHEDELEIPTDAEAIEWNLLPPTEFAGENYWAQFDFDNDGVTDWVWQREDTTRAFEGTYFTLTKPGEWIDLHWFDTHGPAYSGERSPYETHYVHLDIFRYGGRTYLIGTRPSDEREKVLVLTPADGELRQVCLFDRVPENY